MFVKIVAPSGEYKRQGTFLADYVEKDRELYVNLNSICSIHLVGNRLYFDLLRLSFENEAAAQNAIAVLTEAMRNKEGLIEISKGIVTVKALSSCKVYMQNGGVAEPDDGPTKTEPADTEQEQPESVEPTEVTITSVS